MAHEIARSADDDLVVLDVARRLVELLDLTDCAFERAPPGSKGLPPSARPRLDATGDMVHEGTRWRPMQLGFLSDAFDILVVRRGRTRGRFVCRSRRRRRLPEERILAALALCDLAASSMGD